MLLALFLLNASGLASVWKRRTRSWSASASYFLRGQRRFRSCAEDSNRVASKSVWVSSSTLACCTTSAINCSSLFSSVAAMAVSCREWGRRVGGRRLRGVVGLVTTLQGQDVHLRGIIRMSKAVVRVWCRRGGTEMRKVSEQQATPVRTAN